MRKTVAVSIIVLACALFGGFAAAPAAAANVDLIVMVDTSASMLPYFDDLMTYLVQDLLVDRLHRGDTFHLLSFDSTPEVEIALEINSAEAANRAYGRIQLLHALGRYTDLVAALQFLSKYAKELPETNPKQIILITDGVNDPPPGSETSRMSPEEARKAVTDAAAAMKKEGWTFNVLKVPPEPAPGEEGLKSYLPDLARTLGVPIVPYRQGEKQSVTGMTTGFPTLLFPSPLGKVGNRFSAPFRVKNWKSEPIILHLSSVQSDGAELLERKVSVTVQPRGEAPLDVPLRLPLSYPLGDHSITIKLVFDDDARISPTTGTLTFSYTGRGGFPLPRLTWFYVIYIVVGLGIIALLIWLFFFMRKKLREVHEAGLAVPRKAPPSRARGAERGRKAAAEQAAAPPAPPPGGKKGGRGKVSLEALGAGGAGTAGAILAQRRRVRPTVTSLRRALPREASEAGSLPPLIEMRVNEQNSHIGFRNVHRIPPGASRSVGGGLSTYLIFLVRVPQAIGEIRNVDGSYVFRPLRPEMFPGVGDQVEDCLGREIPFVAPGGREMSLHFREWVSPLDEINKLMRSIGRP